MIKRVRKYIRRIDGIQITTIEGNEIMTMKSLFFPFSHERSLFAQGWLFLNSMQFLCRRMVKGLRTVTFRWENATMLRRVFGFRHGRRRVSAESRFADSGRSVINDNWLLLLRESRFCEHAHCVFHTHRPSNQRISPRVFKYYRRINNKSSICSSFNYLMDILNLGYNTFSIRRSI